MTKYAYVESWDWSGAGTKNSTQSGLARATWDARGRPIALSHGYRRAHLEDHLLKLADSSEKGMYSLVGFDFPFSFPFKAKNSVFPDGSTDWFQFAQSVMGILEPDGRAAKFYGSPEDYNEGGRESHFAHLYLGADMIGPNYREVFRVTEEHARAACRGAACVFRLVNPMVGVQSLTGLHLLAQVLRECSAKKLPLTIWPLGYLNRKGRWCVGEVNWEDSGLVIVESYPRVSYVRAGLPVRGLWNGDETLGRAIEGLGAIRVQSERDPENHDELDALMVLLHLLSPRWYRVCIEPDLAETETHVLNTAADERAHEQVVCCDVESEVRVTEGQIYGL